MAILMNVPKAQRHELQEVLDALVAEGKIEVSSKGKYTKGTSPNLTGVFTAHARGFGFVTIEGETEDVFIPESSTNGAIQDDVVHPALPAIRDAELSAHSSEWPSLLPSLVHKTHHRSVRIPSVFSLLIILFS